MIIAVASGKGGTGKTTVAVNLAASIGREVRLLDCDVEEPNCHIFLNAVFNEVEPVGVLVPVVDETKCTGCGECSRMCEYNAIVSVKTKALVFPELCHGCGGCMRVCPEAAITERSRDIGVVEVGRAGPIEFVHGRLQVGEVMSPPLIRAVKRHIRPDGVTILDCPPGTSCPVITAVRGSDVVVLVTEPTPFGLNDLTLAVETVRLLGIPFGVVVNRVGIGDAGVYEYCASEDIPILLEIADDRRVAEAYSRGELAVAAVPSLRDDFASLFDAVKRLAGRQAVQSEER